VKGHLIKASILLFVVLSFACNHVDKRSIEKLVVNNPSSFQNKEETTPGVITDTLYGNRDSIIIIKTKYVVNPPRVTALPFGPKINLNNLYKADKYYTNLIYDNVGELINAGWTAKAVKKIKIYKLPLIKKINYIRIASTVDTDRCANGKLFGSFLKLNKYRYRLPDVSIYQCYYWCDYDPANNQYTSLVRENCNLCLINFLYGYLILYNPKTLEANVIAIYYDTFRDGANFYRSFYIDKDYNITLLDSSQEADDGDGTNPSPIDIHGKHVISISKEGKIQVK
jgi:hypothetical protein